VIGTPTSPKKQPPRFRRIRTPTVIQMEAVECGAAALGIVLGYFGRYVPLEQLRTDCGVSRNGSNARNLAQAGRGYGLAVKGLRAEPGDLPGLPLPQIVFWTFNHFMVVEGFTKTEVLVNDPASGPRRIAQADFDKGFTGIVLSFEKTDKFEKGGRRQSVLRSVWQRMHGNEASLLYLFLTSLALVIPGLVTPAFMRIFIDDMMSRGHVNWILGLLVAMIVTMCAAAALTWMQQYFLARMETRLAVIGAGRFFWHVMRLPMEFYLQRFSGEIGSRVELNDNVAHVVSGRLVSALLNLCMLLFYGTAMFFYDVSLTFVAIGLALVNFVVLAGMGRLRVDQNRRQLQHSGKLQGSMLSGIQMMDTLKASGREGDLMTRWAGYQAQVITSQQELGFTAQVLSTMPMLTNSLGNVAILTLGALSVLNGQMSVGMLMAFMSLMGSFLSPVNILLEYGTDIQEALGDMSRLDDVLENRALAWNPEAAAAGRGKLSGNLELRGITFGYSKTNEPLLSDFNLVARPGARIAIVGTTGSGKSTVGRILCGLYAPWGGEVLFDGTPRDQVPPEVLSASLAYVDQEIVLFDGTIRDNLSMWNPLIDDATLLRALRDAAVDREILERPGGLDSTVLEGGRDLSGGQRQRLEIARALALDPAIIVLDEATSALDALVEKSIDDRLRMRGLTCIIVAHRLSTIRDCDEIIVLEEGKVAQRGTHDTLKDVPGVYRRLIHAEMVAAEAATAVV